MSKYKVAFIEDNPTESFLLKMAIGGIPDVEVQLHSTAKSLLDSFSSSPDIFIVDINLPDMNGLDLVKEINDRKSNAIIFVLSAQESMSIVSKLQQDGVANYIVKNKACLTYLKKEIDVQVFLLKNGYYN